MPPSGHLPAVFSLIGGMILLGGCTPDATSAWADAWNKPATPQPPSPPANVKNAPAPRISPETHYASGTMLETRGDLIGAIDQYERAIAAAPMMGKGYNRLGIVYVKLSRFEEAENILSQGIRVEPMSAQLRNNLGYCYLMQEKYERAEPEFRAALDLNPSFKRARMNLGIVLARTLRLRESAVEFARAVPASVALYNVALVCIEMKEYEHAQRSLQESLRINPEYAPARAQLERIGVLARHMRSRRLLPDAQDGGIAAEQIAGDLDEPAADAP